MEQPRSRREVFAVAAGATALLAGCGKKAEPARTPSVKNTTAPGDLDILSFALTLEYFEAAYYGRLVDEGIFKGRDGELIKRIADNEAAHVDALEATIKPLGGTPPDRPKPNFALLLSGGPQAILGRTAEIENVGPAAYLGQANKIQNKDLLVTALRIHAIEARQAAELNRRVGRPFAPTGALAEPLTRDEVLVKVRGFLL